MQPRGGRAGSPRGDAELEQYKLGRSGAQREGGGARKQNRKTRGAAAPEISFPREVPHFLRVHGLSEYGRLPTPRAGSALGVLEIFCFWGSRPQERNRPGVWLTDCCSVNQLFQSCSRGTQGGIGAARCAEAERSTCGNSVFLAGPRKPSPGAGSGDCGGFLSMVQGAWSKGRMKKCSHERFLRMVQGAWSKGHGPRGVVQGAWSKGHGPSIRTIWSYY